MSYVIKLNNLLKWFLIWHALLLINPYYYVFPLNFAYLSKVSCLSLALFVQLFNYTYAKKIDFSSKTSSRVAKSLGIIATRW